MKRVFIVKSEDVKKLEYVLKLYNLNSNENKIVSTLKDIEKELESANEAIVAFNVGISILERYNKMHLFKGAINTKKIEIFFKKSKYTIFGNLEEKLKCPLCRGAIEENEKFFYCENRESTGCKFLIIKQGKTLTIDREMLKQLLKKEKVETSKAILELDLENSYFIKVTWKSEKSDKPTYYKNYKSTNSNNELVETQKTYKLGDKYIFKEFRGKKLTKAQAKKLLEGEEIILTRTSKAGKNYKVKCRTAGKGTIDAEFA